jgi:hypothetical protein
MADVADVRYSDFQEQLSAKEQHDSLAIFHMQLPQPADELTLHLTAYLTTACNLLQADCLPDPSDVFLHLAERDIGRDHALLYEAYATYLELKGNFKQAELVYQDGINR